MDPTAAAERLQKMRSSWQVPEYLSCPMVEVPAAMLADYEAVFAAEHPADDGEALNAADLSGFGFTKNAWRQSIKVLHRWHDGHWTISNSSHHVEIPSPQTFGDLCRLAKCLGIELGASQ